MDDRKRCIAMAMQSVLVETKIGDDLLVKAYEAARRADDEFLAENFPKAPKGKVRVGQIWEDNDQRQRIFSRHGEVVKIIGDYAEVKWNTGRTTSVNIKRFRPNSTGYKLIQDVDEKDF